MPKNLALLRDRDPFQVGIRPWTVVEPPGPAYGPFARGLEPPIRPRPRHTCLRTIESDLAPLTQQSTLVWQLPITERRIDKHGARSYRNGNVHRKTSHTMMMTMTMIGANGKICHRAKCVETSEAVSQISCISQFFQDGGCPPIWIILNWQF